MAASGALMTHTNAERFLGNGLAMVRVIATPATVQVISCYIDGTPGHA